MAAVTSAVIGGVGLAASIKDGMDRKDAAKDATRAQTKAAADANKVQWDMYSQSRQDQEPFRQNALTASNSIMSLLGLGAPMQQQSPQQAQTQSQFGNAGLFNGMTTGGLAQGQQIGGTSRGGIAGMLGHADGDMRVQHNGFGPIMQQAIARGRVPSTGIPNTSYAPQQQAPAQSPTDQRQAMFDLWRSTPGYQFNLDEGRKQLESSAAARGGLYSGAAGKALTKYGQNYADRTYGDYMNRLSAVAGQAQTINSQNQQAGMNYANQYGQNMANAANARASGLQAKANASSDMWGNVVGIGGWLAGQYGGGASGYPSAGFASGFGNNTGWLSGGGFNNTPGGGGFGWLGGGG